VGHIAFFWSVPFPLLLLGAACIFTAGAKADREGVLGEDKAWRAPGIKSWFVTGWVLLAVAGAGLVLFLVSI